MTKPWRSLCWYEKKGKMVFTLAKCWCVSGSSRDGDLVNWILKIKKRICWKKENGLFTCVLIDVYLYGLTCTCTVLSAPAQVWPLHLQLHQGSERQTARTACISLCQQTSRCQMLTSRFPTLFPIETQNILGIRNSIHTVYLFILVYSSK